MKTHRFIVTVLAILFLYGIEIVSQSPANYDETKVPNFVVPDPLLLNNGEIVTSPQDWWKLRRPEILSFFQNEVYGITPTQKIKATYQIVSLDKKALGGKATKKEIAIIFKKDNKSLTMMVLLYVPNNEVKPPVVLGLNFDGNQTVSDDSTITITQSWVRNKEKYGNTNNLATPKTRGGQKQYWPIELIMDRGYALATVYCGDMDPDFDDGFQNGIQPFFYQKAQTKPAANEWGTIGAWAWGLSRALDYLETEKLVDAKKVAVQGHSRLGKAALWAGAQDQRIALVISNNSGCGGAAMSKRVFGETVQIINTSFPHWFCTNFKKYNGNEAELPFDQHELLALIAPRPVYVTSAEEDSWADPKGEFLSTLYANNVYQLLGKEGMPATQQPAVGKPVMGTLGYHIRPGKHSVTNYDWEHYLNFADRFFKNN